MTVQLPHSEPASGPGARPPSAHLALLVTVCALVIGLYVCSVRSGVFGQSAGGAQEHYYNLLVQGFRAGRLNVNKPVPPELARLAVPYDPAVNAADRYPLHDLEWAQLHRVHDLSYYQGKLYLYFGVTPVMVLFWPYVAVTGRYLLHEYAAAVFFSLGFLAGAGLLRALWRRCFPQVSVWVMLAGTLALGLASFIPLILPCAEVYEVPISCGYVLTMLSLVLLWRALQAGRAQVAWLAAASLAWGLALGARPSLLLGAVILLVPVAQAWRAKQRVWPLLLSALAPVVILGLGLMLYNTRRFGDPLEFGQRYQLPMTWHQQFSPAFLWFNARVGLLEPGRWGVHFPFVHAIAPLPLPGDYFMVWEPFGVLSNSPLVWLALAAPLAWRRRLPAPPSSVRWFRLALTLLFGACALTLALHDSMCLRYEVEFLSPLLLVAVLGIFGLERALSGRRFWLRAARWGWGLLLAFSVAFNLLAGFGLRAEAHCRLGNALSKMGQVAEAIAHYQKAIKLQPDHARARHSLGVALLQTGRADAAIPHLQKVLEEDSRVPMSHYNLANALLQTGQLDEAIRHYQKALELRPGQADAHNNLGYALLRKGQAREAMAHYQMALQLQPDSAGPGNNLAWVLATCPEASLRDGVRALELAQRASQLADGRNPVMLKTLAAAYAEAGRFAEALTAARRAVELARAQNNTGLVNDLEAQIELYRAGNPFRDTGQTDGPARSGRP